MRSDVREGQSWTSADIDATAIGHDLARGTSAFRRALRPEAGATASAAGSVSVSASASAPSEPEPEWETPPADVDSQQAEEPVAVT